MYQPPPPQRRPETREVRSPLRGFTPQNGRDAKMAKPPKEACSGGDDAGSGDAGAVPLGDAGAVPLSARKTNHLIVPRSDGAEALGKLRTSRRVSWILDECIRIPGTRIRFGLDPILGIVPYGGETVASVIGAVILGDAGRRGLPVKTMLRMSGNMLVNAGVGTIPIVGDLFSVWFKSNSRNYRLLVNYLESDQGDDAPGGWGPLLLIGGVVAFVFLINLVSWILFALAIAWLLREWR